MAREKRGVEVWIIGLVGSLICWIASAADPLAHQVEHPFRNVAAWLRKVSPDLKSTDVKTISRGITVLSNSQSYVKSFDGIAYEVKGKLQESTTTSDIDAIRKEAELYESKSIAKKSSKLVKLLVEVENALNSAEAAEIASQFEGAVMAQYMRDAGLRFLPSPPPPPAPLPENITDGETVYETTGKTDKISDALKEVAFDYGGDTREDVQRPKLLGEREYRGEGAEVEGKEGAKEGNPLEAFVVTVMGGCDVQCLVMVDDRDKRLVVAVGDSLTGEALFASLFEEPEVVRLASYGLMRETAYVNRVAFQCACDILAWAGPAIKASLESGPFEGYRIHCVGHSFGGAVAACLAGLLDGAIDVEGAETRDNGRHGSKEDGAGRNTSQRKINKSRDRRKHELGNGKPSPDDEENGWGGEDNVVDTKGAAPWAGICADRVTCVTLGCPPCLSPNIRLPFVTSFVLGDDMVPRTTRESLRRLKRRLLQAMPKGKGIVSQGMAFGTSLFTDVAGVTMQGVKQATTLGEDDARLAVPGRVWFAKPRRLKGGATLSRVMNGNLREDMLWQLHDIMLTKSMLSHHRLDKYINTLNRV